MNIKEFFTKNRSLPPIVFVVSSLVLFSYYFIIAISNSQPAVDVLNVLQENAITFAHGEVIMNKIQSFEDSRVRGDEGEMREAREEILRLQEEFIRKTNEQALLSKEREAPNCELATRELESRDTMGNPLINRGVGTSNRLQKDARRS